MLLPSWQALITGVFTVSKIGLGVIDIGLALHDVHLLSFRFPESALDEYR
jgi:hypothetical protein